MDSDLTETDRLIEPLNILTSERSHNTERTPEKVMNNSLLKFIDPVINNYLV
jgi:hypothetical protein